MAYGFLLASLAAAAQEYEIGPADVLNVIVLGQAPMTGEMAVDADGMLSFPFLGRVRPPGSRPRSSRRSCCARSRVMRGNAFRPQAR